MERVKDWLKRTPLYPVLRAGWHLARPKSQIERIERRDASHTAAILRRVLRPGDHAVDVGAHRGDVLAEFVRASPAGRHVAIEPIPELAERLKIAFPTVEVHAAAAGEAAATARFQWVESNPALSGLKRRPDLSPDETIREIAVPVVRVDDLIPVGRRIAVMKIDVEGGELGAIRGASRVLDESRPWVLLEHGLAAAAYDATSADVFDELARHRMAVWLMGDWLAGKPPLTLSAFVAAVKSGEHWNFLTGPFPHIESD
jgi:FkbM family methyltransferase